MIAVKVLLSLAIIAGFVALEAKKLRMSVMSLAVAGLFFVVSTFLFGSGEVGIGGIVLFAVLVPLLLRALRQTEAEDVTVRLETGNDVFTLVSVIAFIVVVLLAFLPLPGLMSAPPAPVEGSAGLSILREVLVILTALAGVWAVMRKMGRREK